MPLRPLSRPALLLILAAIVLLGALGARALLVRAIAGGLRSAGAARGLDASWQKLRLDLPLRITLDRFALTRGTADTLVRVDSLRLALDPVSILFLHPRPGSVEISHALFRRTRASLADPDTLAPESGEETEHRPDRSARLRRSVDGLVRALLLPARRLPRLALRDLSLEDADPDERRGVRIDWLDLEPAHSGVRLAGAGKLRLEQDIPFAFEVRYADDDRLTGGARFGIPDAVNGTLEPLRVTVDGRIAQERRGGTLRISDSTRFTVGRVPFTVGGALTTGTMGGSPRGPRVRLAVEARDLTPERWKESLPRPVLGPLLDLAVRGAWDWRASLDLDLSEPDSVRFEASVVPHGLRLDPERSKLDLSALEGPFLATIHLPKGRSTTRDLSSANPHYRPLDNIDSLLVHAVVTNEDGAFFRHRGFNTEAVRGAIAENVRAGAYRRGAGTITMQLVRNLWLGHARTLSRKGQEVVLAWVIEHLTALDKRRLLEIYLNIIEWGPDVHGADEAAKYYFGHDAARVSVDEALFLTTVVPAPTKWKYRFDDAGALRSFERAQMHFIGRAMIAKGWLSPEQLPPPDSLRVMIRGAARELLFPSMARADSVTMAPAAESHEP